MPWKATAQITSRAGLSRGTCWRVEFKGGIITTPLHSSTTTAPDGLRIGFTPDPEIFGQATFRFPLLALASREIAHVRHTTVEVREVTSGSVFRTKASGG